MTKLDPRSGAALQGRRGRQRPGGDRRRLRRGVGRQPRRRDRVADRRSRARRSSETVRVGGRPMAVAAGAGAVWVADGRRAPWSVSTRARARRAAGSRWGSAPSALAVAGGEVWAAATASRASHRGGTLRYESPQFDVLPVPRSGGLRALLVADAVARVRRPRRLPSDSGRGREHDRRRSRHQRSAAE